MLETSSMTISLDLMLTRDSSPRRNRPRARRAAGSASGMAAGEAPVSPGGVAAVCVADVAGSSDAVTGPRLAPSDDGGIGFLSVRRSDRFAEATLPPSTAAD